VGSTKLSNEQWEEVLKRITDGERVSDLSREFGVTRATIYNKLGAKSNSSSETLKISKLERENKALRELVGKVTFELSKEKKEI